MCKISWGDFIIFRPKVGEILNFEYFLSLEINLKFKIFFSKLSFIIKVLLTHGFMTGATLVLIILNKLVRKKKCFLR
jgi:hypothetical protein